MRVSAAIGLSAVVVIGYLARERVRQLQPSFRDAADVEDHGARPLGRQRLAQGARTTARERRDLDHLCVGGDTLLYPGKEAL